MYRLSAEDGTVTLDSLDRFVKRVRKHFGAIKSGKIRVEIHEQTAYGWVPRDLTRMAVAKYPKDREHQYPEELKVVLR